MTRTTKTKTEKAKRPSGLEDLAIVAAKEAEAAKAEWLALPADTLADEETPEYKAAVKLLTKAENAFADAPVTSMAGGLVKLRALLKDLVEDDAAHYATAHVETVLAFLEGLAGVAQAEPLVDLWTERNRLVALGNALETDLEIDALGDKLSAVEHRIANTEARTLAGVVVQIKLRESVLGHDAWVLSADLTRNVVRALERMGGASAPSKPEAPQTWPRREAGFFLVLQSMSRCLCIRMLPLAAPIKEPTIEPR